jgi:DNA-binding NtrC family response regulator
MPSLSGIELLKKVKKENPLVRTLLMTAFELDDKLFQEYTKADIINDFLQKPIRLKDLRPIVVKHLTTYKRSLKDQMDQSQ